jgi:phytoene synthase
MPNDALTTIFKSGSTTYFYSSLFFPKNVKKDVYTLYAFVRTADNFVDAVPQNADRFYSFQSSVVLGLSRNQKSGNEIIDGYLDLSVRHGFDPEWTTAFLDAMESDLHWPKDAEGVPLPKFQTYADLQKYMYGSAEVIGLMMAKMLKLPEVSFACAQKQGEAMQLINFIRDIKEDLEMGRIYFPKEDFATTYPHTVLHGNLSAAKLLRRAQAAKPPTEKSYENFIRLQLDRYFALQKDADTGYRFIPRAYRIPIRTAAAMYRWTAAQIEKNPYIIWDKKVKPRPQRVILSFLKNLVTG